MQYITNVAIILRGDRVVKGTIIDVEPEFAATLGDDLTPVGAEAPTEEETTDEKALVDMTAAELKVKATSLGLAASGSKADLIERITLHNGAPTEEEDAN